MPCKHHFLISIPVTGWQETFRSPTSRLAGDQKGLRPAGWQETKKSPASRLAGDTSIFLTGGKWDFQVVNLLLASNPVWFPVYNVKLFVLRSGIRATDKRGYGG